MEPSEQNLDFGLDTAAARAVKKLYFVLLRIVEEDTFLPQDELDFHSRRLNMVFLNSVPLYERSQFSASDLRSDFLHLFNKLIEASLHEEMYEKTANLTRVRDAFEEKTLAYAPVDREKALVEAD